MKSIILETLAEISADYTPERPAPFCQDHDTPDYSDYGDLWEVNDTCIELYGVDITNTIASFEPALYNRIIEKLQEKGELL